jgi:hypothetical protein
LNDDDDDDGKKAEENCIMKSFVIHTPLQILLGRSDKKDYVSEANRHPGRDEKLNDKFSW